MPHKPLILVCNDDGYSAPGIRVLISLARKMGKVVVVAPDKPQSGTAHAVTINHPLRLDLLSKEKDYEAYSCSGTPADCVKLAFKIVMKRRPDLLISGINHGSNASINIIYSGTMAAVFEGALAGVPSIGFSLCDYSWKADFSLSEPFVETIIRRVLAKGLPPGVGLNVNIPAGKGKKPEGIRVCNQANGTWLEDFDVRKDPGGRPYYWLKGVFAQIGNGENTDMAALRKNFISVVPVHFDFTAVRSLKGLQDLNTNHR